MKLAASGKGHDLTNTQHLGYLLMTFSFRDDGVFLLVHGKPLSNTSVVRCNWFSHKFKLACFVSTVVANLAERKTDVCVQ